jgi:hypothetical protein
VIQGPGAFRRAIVSVKGNRLTWYAEGEEARGVGMRSR